MFYFQDASWGWCLNLQDHQHSLSLATNPVYNAVPCFPRDNIVGNRLCDECKKSALPSVCHMLESILWVISQACWPTTRCQVVQIVPSISRQFVSKLLTILQLIRVLLAWIDDIIQIRAWDFVVKLLHFFVFQFTVSLNAFLSMSFHVVRPRYCVCLRFSPSGQFFVCFSRNTRFKHLLILFNNCFIRFAFPLRTWSRNDVVVNIQNCFSISSTWEPYSASFQTFLMSSTRIDRNDLYSMNEHTFPIRYFLPSKF